MDVHRIRYCQVASGIVVSCFLLEPGYTQVPGIANRVRPKLQHHGLWDWEVASLRFLQIRAGVPETHIGVCGEWENGVPTQQVSSRTDAPIGSWQMLPPEPMLQLQRLPDRRSADLHTPGSLPKITTPWPHALLHPRHHRCRLPGYRERLEHQYWRRVPPCVTQPRRRVDCPSSPSNLAFVSTPTSLWPSRTSGSSTLTEKES
jgi:hypothetical protein